jgi:diguanylate cyclase (GGDEF)-like protein
MIAKSIDKPFALIIEDDRDVAALFRHGIDMAGFRTEVVFHGQAAVNRLSNCQPDIILLDLNLPGVSGYQILELIRKDDRLNYTKVIVVTGHSHIADSLSVQPDLVLLKPVSIDQLITLASRITLSNKSPTAIPMQEDPSDRPTGLYSQSFFINRLESSLKQSREIDQYLFAVFLFKLEPKKKIKDQADPYSWETILHEIGDSLKIILRPTDTLARFDPDTFYILIENIPNGDILNKIADRIQQGLYRNIPDIESKIRIPIRIGILLCDRGHESVEMILGDAKYAQMLAVAQGDDYSNHYYQVSVKK